MPTSSTTGQFILITMTVLSITDLQTLMYPHAGFKRVCKVKRTVVFMERLISHAVVHCRQPYSFTMGDHGDTSRPRSSVQDCDSACTAQERDSQVKRLHALRVVGWWKGTKPA